MNISRLAVVGASALALAATACNPAETPVPAAEAPIAAAAPDYAALLLASDRPVADAGRDADRKPADVLAFARITTGQTVFEMEAGSGYYTELISRAVGPEGRIIMQSPKEFEPYYIDDLNARLTNNRLPNVTSTQSPFDQLQAEDASVDVVTWFQGPHEVYFKPPNAPDGLGDPLGSHQEAYRILKPGGLYVVMDHAAAPGSPESTGNDVHRIDPAIVKALINEAGFYLDGESDLLANPDDDYSKGVFDPAVRGRTDQFLLRYRKPT